MDLPSLASLSLASVDARGDIPAARGRAGRRRPFYATRAHAQRSDREAREAEASERYLEDVRIWNAYQASAADALRRDDCPICQDPLGGGDVHDERTGLLIFNANERTLACGHVYHESCLRRWIRYDPQADAARHCMVCKQPDRWLSSTATMTVFTNSLPEWEGTNPSESDGDSE